MRKILITSCSRKKKIDDNLLPAIERYDGPSFRILRKYLHHSNKDVDIYILSAKYGFLQADTNIPFYEQKLTDKRSQELKDILLTQVNEFFAIDSSSKLFVNLGKSYLTLFDSVLSKTLQNALSIKYTSGSTGKRLAEMHDWLYGKQSPLRQKKKNKSIEKETTILGITFTANEQQIHKIVEQKISKSGKKEIENFHSWYVLINEIKVSPKWVVSQLTGLPVGKFHSDQARKALQKLGIKVQRL